MSEDACAPPRGSVREEGLVAAVLSTRSRDRDDVKRKCRLQSENLEAGAIQQVYDEVGVEHVMVNRAVLDVLTRPPLELLPGERLGDASEIAKFDELLDVAVVVLRHRPFEVVLDVA